MKLIPGPDLLASLAREPPSALAVNLENTCLLLSPGRETEVEGLWPGGYGLLAGREVDISASIEIRDREEIQAFVVEPPAR